MLRVERSAVSHYSRRSSRSRLPGQSVRVRGGPMRTVLAATLAAILLTPTPAPRPLSRSKCQAENWESPSASTRSRCRTSLREDDGVTEIGTADLVSGPLLNIQVDDVNGSTTYSYGAGTLALTLTVETGVERRQARSQAPLCPSPSSSARDAIRCSAVGCRTTSKSCWERACSTRPSQRRWASHPPDEGGFIDFGLEAIDGDPDSESRRGFDHRGFANLQIDAVEAPEPGTLVLGLIAAAGLAARRRRAR